MSIDRVEKIVCKGRPKGMNTKELCESSEDRAYQVNGVPDVADQ